MATRQRLPGFVCERSLTSLRPGGGLGWGWLRGDPGLARVRGAAAATASMAVALGGEYAFTNSVSGSSLLAAMILGGVGAMQVSAALMQPGLRVRLGIVAWQPVTVGAALGVSVATRLLGGTGLQLSALVAVTFLAVFIRTFGPEFVILGLIGWVAYFASLFLDPSLAELPFLLGVEVVSGAAAFVVALLVWGDHSGRALGHALSAWSRQTDSLLDTAADLLDPARSRRSTDRGRARLASQAAGLTDTALVVEGWMRQAKSSSRTDARLLSAREQMVEGHLAIDTIVEPVLALTGGRSVARDPSLTGEQSAAGSGAWLVARHIVADLSTREDRAAESRARRLLEDSPRGPIAEESDAANTAAQLDALARGALALVDARRGARRAQEAPPARDAMAEIILLAGGSLPGTAAVAPAVTPRGHEVFHRLSLPVRQAIQVTVAVAITVPIAYRISDVHYSWALLAVFIAFLGTSTRGETAVKAAHRVIGTCVGILVAVPLAALLRGNPEAIIALALAGCFVSHYLVSRSYSYMMFCITVVVLQLYKMMGAFTPTLLGLRAAETALGSAIAVLVAAVVVPVSTSDTAAYVRRELLQTVAAFLDDIARGLEAGRPLDRAKLRHATRAIEDHARRQALAVRPLGWHPARRAHERSRAHEYVRLAARLRQLSSRLAAVSASEAAGISGELSALARAIAHPSEVSELTPTPPPGLGEPPRPDDHFAKVHESLRLIHARRQRDPSLSPLDQHQTETEGHRCVVGNSPR